MVVIGETLISWRSGSEANSQEAALKDYMKVLLAGLAGGPTMIHCTLLAITKIYYELKDIFPDDLIELLLENICLLVTSQSREVVIPSVSFLLVFVAKCPVLESAKFCQKIVQAVCKMTEDCKRHCRLKTRYLLDRLVRKFGYEVVKGLVDKEDETTLKRLKNIKKQQMRKKNLDQENEEDSNDDNDDDFSVKSKSNTMDDIIGDFDDDEEFASEKMESSKGSKKGKGGKTYIADEGIVDFLDASAAQKLRTSIPQPSQKQSARKKKSDFEIAPDGRLIIQDSEDEQDEEMHTKKDQGYLLDDSDDENNEKDFASLVNVRKRKRGTSIASRGSRLSEMSYKSGGTGIHRPLDANSKKNVKEYGSEFKAKKAKGDMKRKGQPDPYAYVPLERGSLNRRKRAKFEGQFKGLVKAAQQGSVKGKKANKSLANKLKNVKL